MARRKKNIYLDTAAATPLDSRALAAMRPYWLKSFANPSSIHYAGTVARRAVEEARAKVAQALETHSSEIIFTSGGTEANNLAIFGVAHQFAINHKQSGHIITSTIEHTSVLEPCRQLERVGWQVTYLPVNADGLVEPNVLTKALRPETALVSIGYANNEIGVIQPIRELAKVIRRAARRPYFHIDACQAPRFLTCRVPTLGVDMMTVNSDKIYGPKGVGALFARHSLELSPLIFGGGQERGLRSGTENVAGIVGFAVALELCEKLREKESIRLTKLRDYFIDHLLRLPHAKLNGAREARLPNNVNVSFGDADSEFVVLNLDVAGVAVSTGSACSTYGKGESHVAPNSVRFTFDRATVKSDLDYVLKILPEILKRSLTSR